MRPTPIPDRRIWQPEPGTTLERRTLGAPAGLEDHVHPVEVLAEGHHAMGYGVQYHLLLQLEGGDLPALAVDPHLWLTFWGAVVPFALTVPGASERQLLGYRAKVDGVDVMLAPGDVDPVYLDQPGG